PGALSVVIPTRNRRRQLAATLAALAQEAAEALPGGPLQVVVVDDGGTDDTLPFLDGFSDPRLAITVLRQDGAGPAAARNRGVAAARGERILFLGDDTRPAPGCLRWHLASGHLATGRPGQGDDGPTAVQGHIDWDPERPVTPLMDFLAPEGPQFYFRGLRDGTVIPFTAVLGSNLSAPRRWLVDEPFDEGFPHAAVEDTEMAWRWQARGWRIVYRPGALCWHDHRYDDLTPFLDRQRRAGASARYAIRKHPRLLWPLALRPTLFGAAVRMRRLLGRGRPTDGWDLACRRAFLKGFLAGGAVTR
ncbi:MAG: glycosyltransferase, partial [Acidobacteriota bacterium]